MDVDDTSCYNAWLVVWNINFIFPYIGNNHPNWRIFFRGVQTTNQMRLTHLESKGFSTLCEWWWQAEMGTQPTNFWRNSCLHWLWAHAYMYMFINVYIYIFIFMYVYIHIYIYIYVRIYTYIYICIYLCTYIYIYIYMYIFMYVYIYIYIYIRVYIYIHIRTYTTIPDNAIHMMPAYVCICIHIYIYIHIELLYEQRLLFG